MSFLFRTDPISANIAQSCCTQFVSGHMSYNRCLSSRPAPSSSQLPILQSISRAAFCDAPCYDDPCRLLRLSDRLFLRLPNASCIYRKFATPANLKMYTTEFWKVCLSAIHRFRRCCLTLRISSDFIYIVSFYAISIINDVLHDWLS